MKKNLNKIWSYLTSDKIQIKNVKNSSIDIKSKDNIIIKNCSDSHISIKTK